MFSHWFTYYIAVGLFAAGMMLGSVVIEKPHPDWRDAASVLLSGLLWPLLLLYILLYDKYNR